jgi:hypothetical protein
MRLNIQGFWLQRLDMSRLFSPPIGRRKIFLPHSPATAAMEFWRRRDF